MKSDCGLRARIVGHESYDDMLARAPRAEPVQSILSSIYPAGIVASVVNKRDVNGGDDEGKKGQEYISL